jgi:hypothetical protein
MSYPTTANWPDLLTPVFRQIFVDTTGKYAEQNDMISRLFNVGTTDRHNVQFSNGGALGSLKRLDEVGKVQYVKVNTHDGTADVRYLTQEEFIEGVQ